MDIIIDKKYRLQQLHYWLKYQISGTLLFLLSWFVYILIFLLIIAALIFTPYMLTVLFKERKFGWIIYFFISVILPAVIIWIFFSSSSYIHVLALIPLALFYFYCFLLRLTISGWLS